MFQGITLGDTDVTLLHSGQEFFVHAVEGIALLAVSVDAQRLKQLADREFGAAELRRLESIARISTSPTYLGAVRQKLRGLLELVVQGEALVEAQVEDMLLECILDLLQQQFQAVSKRCRNVAVSAYLVRQAHRMTLDNLEEPLSVLQVCERLNVSRSTLQRSFITVTGLRPVEYLRTLRLNAARQRLQCTSVEQYTVARVALDTGFTHLGHFAAAYRNLFGEVPSLSCRSGKSH